MLVLLTDLDHWDTLNPSVSVPLYERPYLVGIRSGSVLRTEERLDLTCSSFSRNLSHSDTFTWRVNGQSVWSDLSPILVSDQAVSSYCYR